MLLADFFIMLATDPSEMASYTADPGAYIQGSSLSQANKNLLIAGNNLAEINQQIQAEGKADEVVAVGQEGETGTVMTSVRLLTDGE